MQFFGEGVFRMRYIAGICKAAVCHILDQQEGQAGVVRAQIRPKRG